MQGWTAKDYARWERACGIDEKEIKRRAKERAKLKKEAAKSVNPYEHICQHCGVKFTAKFGYRYCGLLEGCKNDDTQGE